MKNSNWLVYATAILIITILVGLVYVSVQQSHRSVANDPQLQIARDMSEQLKRNRPVDQLMAGDTIEISQSLAVFKSLYNSNGEPIQSTGLLDGTLPKVPKGVFDFTRANTENVLTWQPRRGVRIALVVESVDSPVISYVAVGRSLKEVEKRVSNLTTMLFIGWIICVGIIFLYWFITTLQNRNDNQ